MMLNHLTCCIIYLFIKAFAAEYWLSRGAPGDKIVVGLPLYGRSFRLDDVTNHAVGAPASKGGKPGKYTGEEGYLSYYEVPC